MREKGGEEGLLGYYKCRLCGKKFYSCSTDRETASKIMIDIVVDGESKEINAPGLIHIHLCDDKSIGIADFIGFKKEESDE